MQPSALSSETLQSPALAVPTRSNFVAQSRTYETKSSPGSLRVRIGNNERVLFVGTTGSGKTVLAKYFLQKLSRAIVIDPKHTFRLEGYRIANGLPIFHSSFNIIMRPKRWDDTRMADVLLEAMKRRNIIIYIDELQSVTENFPISAMVLGDIARTGRERGMGLWSATQRPRWVPLQFLTESEVLFVFWLRSGQDRKYIAGYAGEEVEEPVGMHEFYYTRPGEPSPRLLTLDLQASKLREVAA